MTSAFHSRPGQLHGVGLAAVMTCAAVGLGALVAFDERLAVGALGATALVACCFLKPFVGLLCWLPGVFLPASIAGGALWRAGFVLCVAAWVCDAIQRRSITDERIREFRWLVALIIAMGLWFGATVLWATDPTAAGTWGDPAFASAVVSSTSGFNPGCSCRKILQITGVLPSSDR